MAANMHIRGLKVGEIAAIDDPNTVLIEQERKKK